MSGEFEKDLRRIEERIEQLESMVLGIMPKQDKGWRTGRKVFRTLYLDGKLVGMMDTPELAKLVVDALNRVGGTP